MRRKTLRERVAVLSHQAKALEQFDDQRKRAIRRGIAWELTFDQWWTIWQDSGKYDQRGRRGHEYVMARNWDSGPYSVDNVAIKTARENILDYQYLRVSRRVSFSRGAPAKPSSPDVLDLLISEEEGEEAA